MILPQKGDGYRSSYDEVAHSHDRYSSTFERYHHREVEEQVALS